MKGRDTLPLHAQLPWFGFAPLADGEAGLRTMLAKSGELLAVTGVLAIALLAFPGQADKPAAARRRPGSGRRRRTGSRTPARGRGPRSRMEAVRATRRAAAKAAAACAALSVCGTSTSDFNPTRSGSPANDLRNIAARSRPVREFTPWIHPSRPWARLWSRTAKSSNCKLSRSRHIVRTTSGTGEGRGMAWPGRAGLARAFLPGTCEGDSRLRR